MQQQVTEQEFSNFASLMLQDYMRARVEYPNDWRIHRNALCQFVESASKARWPRDKIAAFLPAGYSLGSWIDCLQGKINYPQMPAV